MTNQRRKKSYFCVQVCRVMWSSVLWGVGAGVWLWRYKTRRVYGRGVYVIFMFDFDIMNGHI